MWWVPCGHIESSSVAAAWASYSDAIAPFQNQTTNLTHYELTGDVYISQFDSPISYDNHFLSIALTVFSFELSHAILIDSGHLIQLCTDAYNSITMPDMSSKPAFSEHRWNNHPPYAFIQ